MSHELEMEVGDDYRALPHPIKESVRNYAWQHIGRTSQDIGKDGVLAEWHEAIRTIAADDALVQAAEAAFPPVKPAKRDWTQGGPDYHGLKDILDRVDQNPGLQR